MIHRDDPILKRAGVKIQGISSRDLTCASVGNGSIALSFTVPIRTQTESNTGGHWTRKAARAKSQREAVGMNLLSLRFSLPVLPLTVKMIRLAPQELDDDNLHSAMKHVRDEIAAFYGVDDRNPSIKWSVAQEVAKGFGVKIAIARATESAGGS